MVDIRGEGDNSIQKFCLIGDIVTYLVGVAEKEPSDFLVEQGLLVGTTEFFAKSHVLKREYEGRGAPFGWMQDGVLSCSTGRTAVSLADRGGPRRRNRRSPVTAGRIVAVCVNQRQR